MLDEKLLNDYKDAMKSRDSLKSTLLSGVRAQVLNVAVQKKVNKLDDGEILSVIKKLVKQHQDSIEQFTKGNRMDLVEKEQKELEVLKTYLPKELSPEEIRKIIDDAVVATNAAGIKDMGKVMKEVMAKVGSAGDAKMVSDLVKFRLSQAG